MNRLGTQVDRRIRIAVGDSSRRSVGLVLCGLALAAVFLFSSPAAAADQSVWPLLPYDVQILIAFEPVPQLTPRLRDELAASLAERIEGTVGAEWNATIATAPPALQGTLIHDIEGIAADQVPVPAPPPDKVLLVAVTSVPGGLEVKARDFDVRTHTLSSPVARPVRQISQLSDAVLDALLTAFAPLARIDSSKNNEAVLRPKASGLPPRDPNLALIRKGDVFQAIRRFNDREGNMRGATPVPWTFCIVEKISPEEIRCHLTTPLPSRRGGRVETLALRVVPTGGATVLVLKSRTEPKIPLSGYDVYSRIPGQWRALDPNCPPPVLLGHTDRQGRLLIPPEKHLVRVLLIKNGREALARVPMVPGLSPELTTEIANDDLRLWTEGFIYSLQEELVDVVAMRKIYMALIRARIEKGKLDQANELFETLQKLPNSEYFIRRLNNEQKKLDTNDHVVQKKIDRFLSDTRKVIHQNLDPRAIEEVGRELRDANTAARSAPKSGPKKEAQNGPAVERKKESPPAAAG